MLICALVVTVVLFAHRSHHSPNDSFDPASYADGSSTKKISITGCLKGAPSCAVVDGAPSAPPAKVSTPKPTSPAPAQPKPVKPATPPATATGDVTIPLVKKGGVYAVPARVNGMDIAFLVDSGASDVLIPEGVANEMIKMGSIGDADMMGDGKYKIADGSVSTVARFRIHVLSVGNREVHDVTASIGAAESAPLLGQSFLKKFKSWSIDNERNVLTLK